MTIPHIGVLKVRAVGNPSAPLVDVYFEDVHGFHEPDAEEAQAPLLRTREFPSTTVELQSGLERVMPAAEAIVARVRSSALEFSELSLEFGIRLTVGGPIITIGEAEAHFTLTLLWKAKAAGQA